MAGKLVALIDGRQVDSASEEWRHESEARAIAALALKVAADRLRATMGRLWDARNKPTG